jgi:hypothetical protein
MQIPASIGKLADSEVACLTRALHEPSGVSGLGKTKVLRYQGKLGLLKSQSTG